MSEHTPGPWSVGARHLISDEDEQHGYTITAVGGTVAEKVLGATFHIATVGANPCDIECEDNVRLIAAAPELLAACQAAIGAIQYLLANDDNGPAENCIELLAGAINKAEGRING